LMYVEGDRAESVESWVAAVQGLRYKDYQLARRPEMMGEREVASGPILAGPVKGFWEAESVTEFAEEMGRRGVREWWRRAMGYAGMGGGQ